MGRVIYREFLKALPQRTLLWMVALWLVFLVWILVLRMGDQYMSLLRDAARSLNLTTPEQFQEFFELAPPRQPVKGTALLLSPRHAASHGLGLIISGLAPWTMVILGAKLFGDEYAFGTIRRLWTEGPPRIMQLAGKLGALCLAILAAMALTCIAAVLLTPVVRWFYPIPWAPAADFLSLGQLAERFVLQLAVSMAILLFLAVLAAAIAAAARSAFAGAVAAAAYYWFGMFGLENLLSARIQPLLPGWHVTVLQALAFPEFAAGPFQAATVQMGYRSLTANVQRELPAMVLFQLPPAGPEPSLVLSLAVLGAYLALLTGALHVLWHRQEAP